jgi:hypothetical protein
MSVVITKVTETVRALTVTQTVNSFHVIRNLPLRVTPIFAKKKPRVKYFENGSSLKK